MKDIYLKDYEEIFHMLKKEENRWKIVEKVFTGF